MTRPPFDFRGVVQLLGKLRRHVAVNELAVLRMLYLDPSIGWDTFPTASYSLPGANVGQFADARYSIADGSSLHLQLFRSAAGVFVDIHLDDQDPLVSPIGHAAQATHALEYGAWGGIGAGLLALLVTRDEKVARVLGGLGVGTGVFLGAHTPKQTRRVFLLSDFVAAWRLCA